MGQRQMVTRRIGERRARHVVETGRFRGRNPSRRYTASAASVPLPSLSFILTYLSVDSICNCPAFYQCHAGQRCTGGKPHPPNTISSCRPNPIPLSPCLPRNPAQEPKKKTYFPASLARGGLPFIPSSLPPSLPPSFLTSLPLTLDI